MLMEAVAIIAISIITITECNSSHLSNTVLGVSGETPCALQLTQRGYEPTAHGIVLL
jgi:hypothetical protein